MIAVEERVVDSADEVARRVEVHVHLLDDHALLALDLVGIELGAADHVDEHVERDAARLRCAPDVITGVLLAREGVELAPDRVDFAGDVAGARAFFGALEEHVLGEVGDAVGLARLVTGTGGDHDHAGHRAGLGHRGRKQAKSVRQDSSLEDHAGHANEEGCRRGNAVRESGVFASVRLFSSRRYLGRSPSATAASVGGGRAQA